MRVTSAFVGAASRPNKQIRNITTGPFARCGIGILPGAAATVLRRHAIRHVGRLAIPSRAHIESACGTGLLPTHHHMVRDLLYCGGANPSELPSEIRRRDP